MKRPLEAVDIIEFQAMQIGLHRPPHYFSEVACAQILNAPATVRRSNIASKRAGQ